MVYIYYTVFEAAINQNKYQEYFEQMPADIQARINRYAKKINKLQLLYGRILLQKILQGNGFPEFRLADVQYNQNNKPFWKKVHFSIAHSGHIVGCALALDQKIGLDIEKRKLVQVKNFRHILNTQDCQLLDRATDPQVCFFQLWTLKEALSKADGRGLGLDVQTIITQADGLYLNGQKWHYQALSLPETYMGHIVMERWPEEGLMIRQCML